MAKSPPSKTKVPVAVNAVVLSAASSMARLPSSTPTVKSPAPSCAVTLLPATSILAPERPNPKLPPIETKPAISTASPTTEIVCTSRPAVRSALIPSIAIVSGVAA